jgi:hypothetical protein
MSAAVAEALEGYVKTWNRGIVTQSRPRLAFSHTHLNTTPTCEVRTQQGECILWIRDARDGRATGAVNLESLSSGSVMDTESGHKFISEIVQLSWAWRPPSIKSAILAPSLIMFNTLFPRWGVKLDTARVKWFTNQAACIDWILRHSYRVATILYQASPTSSPSEVRKYVYESPPRFRLDDIVVFTPPTPVTKSSCNFSSVDDDIAEEGGLTCSVCMTNKPCAAAKCGHLATCGACATRISGMPNPKCPKCRGPWTELQRIFL